jgi:3-deoxy-D-manno-octulosonate 8-phosphate phosphatase KdsC-like HAD superfamily phosphatase
MDKELKVTIHHALQGITDKNKVRVTKEGLLALTEISFEYFKLMGSDLEDFSK